MNPLEKRSSVEVFHEDGFIIRRGFCPQTVRNEAIKSIQTQLDPVLAPAEFEADVGYPGAPAARGLAGGMTPRRLLSACSRFPALRDFALGRDVAEVIRELLGEDSVSLAQAHHNCVMTKAPDHSSATLWHQDMRYWSFDRPELVTMWIALGSETVQNGCLRLIPGSHRRTFDRGQFDHALFLRPDFAPNKPLLRSSRAIELAAGDVLFFHCRLLHAAGPNRTDHLKLAGVFTYHATCNQPIPGTRSAQYASIGLP
jgi:phytanoyl-CoA hydroxylase